MNFISSFFVGFMALCLASSNPVLEKPMERADLFQGDILLADGDNNAKGIAQAGTNSNRWSGGVVPYYINPGNSNTEINTILSGMRLIEDLTRINGRDCIRFVPRSNQLSYLRIIRGGGCYSYVGKVWNDRPQDVSIGGGCFYPGIVAHELIHALGFNHEQTRPDRDSYVRIRYENVVNGQAYNFDKATSYDTLGYPYDYNSIMHYESTAFSKNGQPTIVPLQSGVQLVNAAYKKLSNIDIGEIRKYYNCK